MQSCCENKNGNAVNFRHEVGSHEAGRKCHTFAPSDADLTWPNEPPAKQTGHAERGNDSWGRRDPSSSTPPSL